MMHLKFDVTMVWAPTSRSWTKHAFHIPEMFVNHWVIKDLLDKHPWLIRFQTYPATTIGEGRRYTSDSNGHSCHAVSSIKVLDHPFTLLSQLIKSSPYEIECVSASVVSFNVAIFCIARCCLYNKLTTISMLKLPESWFISFARAITTLTYDWY